MRSPLEQEFLESQGVLLNEAEAMPVDPYTQSRRPHPQAHVTPSDFDRLRQFLTMDRKVTQTFPKDSRGRLPSSNTLRAITIRY